MSRSPVGDGGEQGVAVRNRLVAGRPHPSPHPRGGLHHDRLTGHADDYNRCRYNENSFDDARQLRSASTSQVLSTCSILCRVSAIRWAGPAGLDDEALHWLNVAVRECVINAINHGNGNDANKRVHLEFTPFEDQTGPGVSIRVRDEGAGFDPETPA